MKTAIALLCIGFGAVGIVMNQAWGLGDGHLWFVGGLFSFGLSVAGVFR